MKTTNPKKIKISLLFFFFSFLSLFSQTIYEISDPEELEELSLSAGDQVILANGTYSSDERIVFSGSGTANNPIILKAETPGGVIFDNGLQMDIAGNYLIVDGFYWNSGYGASNFIQFRNGTTYAQNSIIQNCAINGLVAEPGDAEEAAAEGAIIKHRWIVLYGNYNSVLNCTFMNKNTAGALVLAEYEYNAEEDRCIEVGHTISNNYFYNYEKIDPTLSNAGDSETIRIGTSEYQNVNSAAIVSGNYFVQADGENEIITNKSINNTYVGNTFRRCRGSLVMRHGANAIVEQNYFLGENVEGTGAIRITDSNHQITNNYIQDCVTVNDNAIWNNGVTFVGGNTNSVQDCNTTSVSNAYQDVENILFSNNTFINTNSPILFNDSRDGASNVFGSVSDNLIYFENGNSNVSNIINENDGGTSYNEIGTELAFTGNVFDGTDLGITVTGFTNEAISITSNGEIFNHNQNGKGAVMNDSPLTDSDVGNTVGTCFLDVDANILTGCDGTVTPPTSTDNLTVSTLNTFASEVASQTITVTSNIDWTVSENSNWITINTTNGSNNGSVIVTVSENASTSSRTATITISGEEITRSIIVMQEGEESLPPTTVEFVPDPSKTYYIDSAAHNVRLAASGQDEDPYTTSTNTTGNEVEWQFVENENGFWHIQLTSGGSSPRFRSRNNGEADMQNANSNGTRTYFNFVEGSVSGSYFMTLPDANANYRRVQVDNADNINFVSTASNGSWESFFITEVNDDENNNSTTCSEGTNLALNTSIVDFSAEQNTTNTVNNIIDGNEDNRWSASGFPQYATIDLGEDYDINQINLSTYQDRDYQFTVEGSTASATSGFSLLTSGSGPGESSFAPQTVRYIKLTINGADSYTGSWCSITNFEIICAGTSAKSITENQFFEVITYPNPFINSLNVFVNEPFQNLSSLNLIDITGKIIEVKRVTEKETSIENLDRLSKGLYLLQLLDINGKIIATKKIVKE